VLPQDRTTGTEATTQNQRGEIDDRRHWAGAKKNRKAERDQPALGKIRTRVLVATGARRLHDGNGRQRLTHRRIDKHEQLTRAAAQQQIDAAQRENDKRTRLVTGPQDSAPEKRRSSVARMA
jgi:hypothetical protein